MKKVLYVASNTKYFSGADWSLFRLILHLKDKLDICILLPDRGELFEKCREAGISALVIPYIPTGKAALSFPRIFSYLIVNTLYILRLMCHVLRYGIDIVHVNEIYNFPALIASKLACAKTVCHVRAGVLPTSILKTLTQSMVNLLADRVIYVSHAVKKLWCGGNIPSQKLTVIHNTHPDAERFAPRHYPATKDEMFVVGTISKICKEKGQHYLVETAAKIREMGVKNIEYSIVGGKLKGHEDYYNNLLGLIESLGLVEKFRLHGMREDTPEQLSRMDVFIHTPDFEDPFPTVVLEAMMMQKPVVCFNRGGISEQFDDGVSGILVPAGDTTRLAEKIAALYKDPARRKSMGENARREVLERFNPSNTIETIIDVYDSLLRNRT